MAGRTSGATRRRHRRSRPWDGRSQPVDHGLPPFALDVVLEGSQGRGHDIAVMHLRPHDLDGFHPQGMNALDVGTGQVRRMGPE